MCMQPLPVTSPAPFFFVISSRFDGFSHALACCQRKKMKLMIYNTFRMIQAMSLLHVNEKRLLFGKWKNNNIFKTSLVTWAVTDWGCFTFSVVKTSPPGLCWFKLQIFRRALEISLNAREITNPIWIRNPMRSLLSLSHLCLFGQDGKQLQRAKQNSNVTCSPAVLPGQLFLLLSLNRDKKNNISIYSPSSCLCENERRR